MLEEDEGIERKGKDNGTVDDGGRSGKVKKVSA